MKLRNAVVKTEEERLEFDRRYLPVTDNLEEALEAKDLAIKLLTEHMNSVEIGRAISVENKTIKVDEPVDAQLNKSVKDFFIKGEIAVSGLLSLCKHLEVNINFFSKNDQTFEKESKKFLEGAGKGKEQLIMMLNNDRSSWYSKFNSARNKFEHEGFRLPRIDYYITTNGKVQARIPTIESMSIQDFLNLMWGNLFEFVEDVMATAIGFKLESPWVIVEIPEEHRDPSMPVRYVIGINTSSGPIFPKS